MLILNTKTFYPACLSVSPGDSVLLPMSKVPSYLDVALKALTLHTEACTLFIKLRIYLLLSSVFVEGVKKQPSQDILQGDAAEELGLACLVSSYTLPHQNSQPGRRG